MLLLVALCAIGAVAAEVTNGATNTTRLRRSPSEFYLSIVSEGPNIKQVTNDPNLPPELAAMVWNLALRAGNEHIQPGEEKIVRVPSEPNGPNVVVIGPFISAPSHRLNISFGTEDNEVDVGPRDSFPPEEPKEEEFVPFADGSQVFQTSDQMVQSYRKQRSVPPPPEIPALISESEVPLPDRIPVRNPIPVVISVPFNAPPPPSPNFDRTLRLRVDLTATDYTEAYDVQWHAETDTARTVVEDGSTKYYRTPLADGRVQYLEVRLDRSEGRPVRRCMLSPLMAASRADRTFPGLPVTDEFVFAGYTSAEGQPLVERWQRVMVGRPGGFGAVEGESLNFTHDLLITRDRGEAVPLRYTVITDSSVLGPGSDTYIHRYAVLPTPIDPAIPNFNQECDVFDQFQIDPNATPEEINAKVIAQFDPLREFAGPTRDGKYDSMLTDFKKQYKRKYLDPAEEAVRKSLMIKSARYIAAGNRLGSSFKMEANFMSDRLNDEINQLYGVESLPDNTNEPGLVPFPYSTKEVKEISNKLEDEFDWRPLGAVSPVRFQEGKCASCWAFAVAGSTEGALFKKTKKLVPLSPQCLVDCAKPFGAHGCDGTWPSFGYDYVQAKGLPAWDEYTPYQAKVLQCKDDSVKPVTHISGHVNITANSEEALKVAIKNHAPSVVVVDALAQSFIFYKSGVLKDKRCGANKEVTPGGGVKGLNHAMLAVGWGKKDGDHFILKNTWSAKWGESGYIRMAPDSCGILERPSYSLIEKPNIDKEDLRAAAS